VSGTAYIGRYRSEDGWKLQLVGAGEYPDIYAAVDIPDDTITLALADEFLYGIAAAKDLTIKARRRNDE
jgi:hypothetical protein